MKKSHKKLTNYSHRDCIIYIDSIDLKLVMLGHLIAWCTEFRQKFNVSLIEDFVCKPILSATTGVRVDCLHAKPNSARGPSRKFYSGWGRGSLTCSVYVPQIVIVIINTTAAWHLCGEFTGDRWIPAQVASNTESVCIWWHCHGVLWMS